MIRICEDNKRISGAKARYISASFFEYNFDKLSFDLISALGFIEYISTKALDELFKRVGALLNSEGTFAIGSRNRIFNVFSRNAYTLLEEKLSCYHLAVYTTNALNILKMILSQKFLLLVFVLVEDLHKLHYY